MRPNRRVELWYRVQLGALVDQLREAGAEVVEGLRWQWQAADRRRLVAVDEEPSELEALIARAAGKFGNIEGDVERLAETAARRNLGQVDDRLAATIKQSVGVDLRTALTTSGPIRGTLLKAAQENFELITSIPPKYFDRVREEITKAWTTGLRWESLAETIAHVGNITDSRARLIARDQTSKMTGAFNEARQVALGITRYTWNSVGDVKVRPSHGKMNGKICHWSSPPEVDGERVHPQQAVNCRCAALPIVDLDEMFGGSKEADAA